MPDGATADALAEALQLRDAWFRTETDAIAGAILLPSKMSMAKQVEVVTLLLAPP